jgi:glycosyltransferase involved in cell wall biosynthesis
LAERGRKRVKEFSWAACARQTLDVYRNLAG